MSFCRPKATDSSSTRPEKRVPPQAQAQDTFQDVLWKNSCNGRLAGPRVLLKLLSYPHTSYAFRASEQRPC